MDSSRGTASQPENSGETRRSFYVAAIYGMGALISAALAVPALLYLLIPPKMRRKSDWIPAGDLGQVPVGTPVQMSYRRMRVDGWKVTSEQDTVWVLKSAQNQVVAYSPACTHLGCAYHWDDGRKEFVCPCHNSIFGIDGRVLGGPAPRPLDRYETRVQGNTLLLGSLHTSSEPGA